MRIPDSEWVMSGPATTEVIINHIGISNERSKKSSEALTEEEIAIFRDELGG